MEEKSNSLLFFYWIPLNLINSKSFDHNYWWIDRYFDCLEIVVVSVADLWFLDNNKLVLVWVSLVSQQSPIIDRHCHRHHNILHFSLIDHKSIPEQHLRVPHLHWKGKFFWTCNSNIFHYEHNLIFLDASPF